MSDLSVDWLRPIQQNLACCYCLALEHSSSKPVKRHPPSHTGTKRAEETEPPRGRGGGRLERMIRRERKRSKRMRKIRVALHTTESGVGPAT